jgi:hypothetical protein
MNPFLRNPMHCIAHRAHLYGAEQGDAARARYWREVAALCILEGHRWPEAEALGHRHV